MKNLNIADELENDFFNDFKENNKQEEELKPKETKVKTENNLKKEFEGSLNAKNSILPYKSIDVLFNGKNIYMNTGKEFNPVSLTFDLFDESQWTPALRIKDDTQSAWSNNIPSFYNFRNFVNPMDSEEIAAIEKKIQKEVTMIIKEVRMSKNLLTVVKKVSNETEILVDLYGLFLELKEARFIDEEGFKSRVNNWRETLKKKMPDGTRFSIIPLQFNFISENHIGQYISAHCREELQSVKKSPAFHVKAKIFQYPNRIFSVRIMITMLYKVSTTEKKKEDEGLFETELDFIEDE